MSSFSGGGSGTKVKTSLSVRRGRAARVPERAAPLVSKTNTPSGSNVCAWTLQLSAPPNLCTKSTPAVFAPGCPARLAWRRCHAKRMRIAMLKIAVTSRWSLAIRKRTSNGKVSVHWR
jgi:hypothetical protein